jgi:CRP/FNR family transcriptional regulator, cyclic AMP receptor protein
VNASVLRSVNIFVDVPASDLEALAAGLRRRRYARGQVIFTQGDPGTSLCIIEEGRVRIVVGSDEGKELVLRVLGPGDVFGELALLDGEPRSADAVAQEVCQLVLLQRSDFLAFVEARPKVATNLLAALSRKLRFTTQQAQEVAFLDVPARLARTVLGQATVENGGAPVCRLTQSELAGLVGATRESVNKWLGYYERQGLIRRQRGAVTVLNPEALRRRS